MTDQLRKIAESEAKNEFHPDRQPFNLYDARRLGYVRGFIAGRTSVPEFRFTDEEWREYQAIPDQGYSHRAHLEHVVNRRFALLNGESDAANDAR